MKIIEKQDLLELAERKKFNKIIFHILIIVFIAILFVNFILDKDRSLSHLLVVIGLIIFDIFIMKAGTKINEHKSILNDEFYIICLPVLNKKIDINYKRRITKFYIFFSDIQRCMVSKEEFEDTNIGDWYYVVMINNCPNISFCFSSKKYMLGNTIIYRYVENGVLPQG